ncbi:MAG: methionyl-tRNA formyltransferase [Desulfobaccales bacterium]
MKSGAWRLIFMGTPQFALPSLEAVLAAGDEVAAVVTQPDRPRGRGQVVTPSPVKELALAWNLPVLQPQRLKDPELISRLQALAPELIIVVAYGRILPHEILALPSVGLLNVHASLLPRYRGSAPINWALIRGEKETGVTIQWLRHEVDSGPIFLQERVPIAPEDNFGTLYDRLAERGAALLLQSLEMLRRGEAVKLPQDIAAVTQAPPISREMRRLHWELSARDAAGWIRSLDPRPGAYTLWQGRVLKLFGGRIKKSEGSLGSPGAVLRLTPQGLEIACGQGSVTVEALQLAGHKRLSAAEFLRGQPLIKQVLE